MKIKINNLTVKYGILKREKTILDNVWIEVKSGTLTAITGKSGSGKTTLLESIAGLIKANGEVFLDGVDILSLKEKERAAFRLKHIGYVAQFPKLVDELNVLENIVLPIHLNKRIEDNQYIDHIMELLDIKDISNNYPDELSGGQLQRVALARAMANKPRLILADEPTGNLDNINTIGVLEALKKCQREYNYTILLVTHDINIAKHCDSIYMLDNSQIKELVIS